MLIMTAPLILFLALLIRLDSPGPILFRQTRIGHWGNAFTMYKFRSMTHSDNSTLQFFEREDGRRYHKIKNDPRITRVGRFIRRSSLDELPQLINVVRGEMSLVGPRPEL